MSNVHGLDEQPKPYVVRNVVTGVSFETLEEFLAEIFIQGCVAAKMRALSVDNMILWLSKTYMRNTLPPSVVEGVKEHWGFEFTVKEFTALCGKLDVTLESGMFWPGVKMLQAILDRREFEAALAAVATPEESTPGAPTTKKRVAKVKVEPTAEELAAQERSRQVVKERVGASVANLQRSLGILRKA